VKVILRTRLSATPDTSHLCSIIARRGHDVDDASGKLASSISRTNASAVSGVSSAGLATTVHPAARSRGNLACEHCKRKVPRRDCRHDANRFLHDHHLLAAHGFRYEIAVGADRFLGEPLDVGRAIGDLTPGLMQRFALLAGDESRQILGVGDDQGVPSASATVPVHGR